MDSGQNISIYHVQQTLHTIILETFTVSNVTIDQNWFLNASEKTGYTDFRSCIYPGHVDKYLDSYTNRQMDRYVTQMGGTLYGSWGQNNKGNPATNNASDRNMGL